MKVFNQTDTFKQSKSYPMVITDAEYPTVGRGYQINVERGFDSLVEQSPHATLLGWINALDKQLENLLTEKKAETIKILPNSVPARRVDPKILPLPRPAKENSNTHTQQHVETAATRRKAETMQLEARLGRLPLFSKSSDGITYSIPIQPRKHEDLPVPLQAVKAVKLIIPLSYPLQQCKVEIQGVSRDAAAKTERNFECKAKESPDTSLMGHVNYLAQHMHILATEPEPSTEGENDEQELQHVAEPTLVVEPAVTKPLRLTQTDDDRNHIKVIPRPPEWTVVEGDGGSDDSDYSDSYDSGDETTDYGDDAEQSGALETVSEGPERGLSLSFPFLELYGIELLELTSLYLSVKCERCKETVDIPNIRTGSGPRLESCKKCASALIIGFRKELMHAHSVRAGYVDLDGCTVLDMLPR